MGELLVGTPRAGRAGCWHRHDQDDARLGEPLCPSCYDAQAQVLWNALAPELWRRTTIAIHRALGRLVGLQEGELRRLVRISYAKVAEFQRRGAIHFHAVIRLDAAATCRCPECLLLPPEPFGAELLEEALKEAVRAVTVPCPPLEDGGPQRYARWWRRIAAPPRISQTMPSDAVPAPARRSEPTQMDRPSSMRSPGCGWRGP
jgi:Replication initiator protein, pSAM2